MSPLEECCTTCECGRIYCRDYDDTCPDCRADEQCHRDPASAARDLCACWGTSAGATWIGSAAS